MSALDDPNYYDELVEKQAEELAKKDAELSALRAEVEVLRADLALVVWDAFINGKSQTKEEADEIASRHWKTWQEVAAALNAPSEGQKRD